MECAVGYIRRSKKSDTHTISLEEQEEKIRHYARENNLNCAMVVSHDGISGTKRGRFDAIEKAITAYTASTLLVYHLDRLARDVAGLLDYLRSLHKRRIMVVEVTTGRYVDLSKSDDFLLTTMQGVFAELFPKIIGEKTKAALARKKITQQRYTNIPPFGYTYIGDKAQGFRLVTEPEEQRALEIIRECGKAGLTIKATIQKVRSAQYLGRLGRMTVAKYRHGPIEAPPDP